MNADRGIVRRRTLHRGWWSWLLPFSMAASAACGPQPDADPRMVSEWIRTLYGTVRAERLSPPVASRILAYAATALYAGLAVDNANAVPLSEALNGLSLPEPDVAARYDGTLVALAAERVVLDSLLREALPATRAAYTRLVDSLASDRLRKASATKARAHSERLGTAIGLSIVAWSRHDGFDATRGRTYVAPSGPGLWVNDAPVTIYASQNLSGVTDFVAVDDPANVFQAGRASDRALILNRPKDPARRTMPAVDITGVSEPYWGEVRPFVLERWDECTVPPPPPYSTDPSSAFHREAMIVRETARALTAEQRAVALFWADNAGESGTPPGHWLAIASQMIRQRGLTGEQAARLMLVTAVAQADALIAAWGYKYRYNLIRPRTYIRSVIDTTWEPLIPTPPFPEYPSGHSTQSAAAATVIAALVGDAAFDDSTSVYIGHAVRRFPSLSAAAEETGQSRVYGGIHFPFGNAGGRELGRCIGTRTVERFGLRPPPR